MSEPPDSLLHQAMGKARSGSPEEAVKMLTAALADAPGDRHIRMQLGNALRMAGQADQAREQLQALASEHPGDEDIQFALAFLLREQGLFTAAEKALVELCAHNPDLNTQMKAVGFLRDTDRFAAALQIMDSVIARTGPSPQALFRRARLRQALGNFAGALADCRQALDGDSSLGGAWLSLGALQHFETEDDPDFQRMRAAREQVSSIEARVALWFALGKAFDDLDRYAQAWEHFSRGNQLQASRQPWHRSAWQKPGQPIPADVSLATSAAEDARRPVFIVGMLRSGTTLLEQLLARDSRLVARGELNWLNHFGRRISDPNALSEEECRMLGEDLWHQMRRDGPADAIYIDKNPLNFRHIDLALRLLPNARFIHMMRDGRASTLSCYQQLFQHPAAGFSNSLEDLEHYYRNYREWMHDSETRWGDRILQMHYQVLVRDPDAEVNRVKAWLNLNPGQGQDAPDVAPVRTASTWQARQPVHTRSVEKWRRYEPFAADFFDRIARIDARFDDA